MSKKGDVENPAMEMRSEEEGGDNENDKDNKKRAFGAVDSSIEDSEGEETDTIDGSNEKGKERRKKRKIGGDADAMETNELDTIDFSGYEYMKNWFLDIDPLELKIPTLPRQMETPLALVETQNQQESLNERKQEAVNLGVLISYLVAEFLYLSRDEVLDTPEETFHSLEDAYGIPMDTQGIVMLNLSRIFNFFRVKVKEDQNRPILSLSSKNPEHEVKQVFMYFATAIVQLQDVVLGIRNLELQGEKDLSALDSKVVECKDQLGKIGTMINEKKLLCFGSLPLSTAQTTDLLVFRTDGLQKAFTKIWSSVFEPQGETTEANETVSPETGGDVSQYLN